jgi:hypothetical protein
VYLATTVCFTQSKIRPVTILLLLIGTFLLYKSNSRTALGSAFFGFGLCGFIVFKDTYLRPERARQLIHIRPELILGLLTVGIIGGILTMSLAGVDLSALVDRVLTKGRGPSVGSYNAADLIASRMFLAEESYHYFLSSPIYGVGFGTSGNPFWIATYGHSIAHAPIEKGFIFTAVLEEIGLIGFVGFIILIGGLYRMLAAHQNYPGKVMLFTLLLINCGQVHLFSYGGAGLMHWMFVLSAGLCMRTQPLGLPKRSNYK